ncbi:MAG: hypothetical protein RLY16_2084, partial [Bacteroidota bacterium]
GLQVTNISTTAATLNWTTISGVLYSVDYRAIGASSWNSVLQAGTSNTFNLTGLVTGTDYEWRVNANCNNTLAASYATGTFSTSSRNSTISNIEDGFGMKLTPNPVNQAAILDYIVPGSGTVSLGLFSVVGQKLQHIPAGVQVAGQYQLDLSRELKALIAGVYILRLEQNGKGISIKFVKK